MSSGRRSGWFAALAFANGMVLGGTQAALAEFFDNCVADGDATITVSQDTTVRNENVTLQASAIQQNCDIDVADGVSLRLQNVKISVENAKRIFFLGGGTSTLTIKNTNFNACDTDIFGFETVDITHSTFVDPPDGGIAVTSKNWNLPGQ